jgi:hypothetical protein
LALARRFSLDLADRHNVVVDLAVHDPRPNGDPRNFHAHLLATTREPNAGGFGAKAGLDMNSRERIRLGLSAGLVEFVAIRERWASLVNDAFRAAGMTERVDHRSLKAQGIDREPLHIPYVAFQLERRGLRSEVAERIRTRYQARVAEKTGLPAGGDAIRQEAAPAASTAAIEQLQRRARAAWLALRGEAQQVGKPLRAAVLSQSATAPSSRPKLAAASELQNDAADTDLSL